MNKKINNNKKCKQPDNNSEKEHINISGRPDIITRSDNLDFAKKLGINEEALDDIYVKIEKEQKDIGVPEDQIEDRVHRRVRITLINIKSPPRKRSSSVRSEN